MLRCLRVTVEARERVPTQIDGDVLGTTPLEIDAGTTELRLIVPTDLNRTTRRQLGPTSGKETALGTESLPGERSASRR